MADKTLTVVEEAPRASAIIHAPPKGKLAFSGDGPDRLLCGGCSQPNVIDALIDGSKIGGKSAGGFSHRFAETIDAEAIHRAHNVMRKPFGRGLFEGQIVARTQARIDSQRDGKWQGRLFVKDFDLLRYIVFLEQEIVFREPADGSALRIRDRHKYIHQVDIDPKGRFRLGLALGVT